MMHRIAIAHFANDPSPSDVYISSVGKASAWPVYCSYNNP